MSRLLRCQLDGKWSRRSGGNVVVQKPSRVPKPHRTNRRIHAFKQFLLELSDCERRRRRGNGNGPRRELACRGGNLYELNPDRIRGFIQPRRNEACVFGALLRRIRFVSEHIDLKAYIAIIERNGRLADVGSNIAVWKPGEVFLPEAGQVCADSCFRLLLHKLPFELAKRLAEWDEDNSDNHKQRQEAPGPGVHCAHAFEPWIAVQELAHTKAFRSRPEGSQPSCAAP